MGVELYNDLKSAILSYDAAKTAQLAQQIVQQRLDPLAAFEAMTDAIRHVGEQFGEGILFLPELVGAAEAMQAATPVLTEEIEQQGGQRESAGKVVIGSVFGDMHNIGKTMVCTLLTADGFEVIDLGINVETHQFVEAVKAHDADIVAMSALLTTTAHEQKKVIDSLVEDGLRDKVKVMVGGGAISDEFAESIGADGYDPMAPGAVKLARRFMGL